LESKGRLPAGRPFFIACHGAFLDELDKNVIPLSELSHRSKTNSTMEKPASSFEVAGSYLPDKILARANSSVQVLPAN
jgi:hypothetical protein